MPCFLTWLHHAPRFLPPLLNQSHLTSFQIPRVMRWGTDEEGCWKSTGGAAGLLLAAGLLPAVAVTRGGASRWLLA